MAEAEDSPRAGWRLPIWQWLVPALACAMFALALLGHSGTPVKATRAGTTTLFASIALSNQMFNACQTSVVHHPHNLWLTVSLPKSNHAAANPTTATVLSMTNFTFKQ